jgi:serine/threonine protein kinase
MRGSRAATNGLLSRRHDTPDGSVEDGKVVIGQRDRRYEIVKMISQGGMGTVQLGRMQGPLGFSKRVAIKSLRHDRMTNPAIRELFINEARLTSRLNHANIASTVDVVIEPDAVYIVMEYIDGSSVAELAKAAKAAGVRIPTAIACAIVHDALLGLDHAHDAVDENCGELGIVHCDVSPQNVRVGTDGLTRILDFGIARANEGFQSSTTRLTKLHGKIPYMAPEQIQGASLDRRVDVYAAGVLLWELLVGRRLFNAPTAVALVSEVLTSKPRRPSAVVKGIPADLEAVIMRALSKDPDDRFASAGEMAAALAACTPLASRREIANLLYDFCPSEHTAASGIRCVRTTPPPRPSILDTIVGPFATTRARLVRAVLPVVAIGLLGLALGASRRATIAPARASTPPPVATALAAPVQVANVPAAAGVAAHVGPAEVAAPAVNGGPAPADSAHPGAKRKPDSSTKPRRNVRNVRH